MPLLFPQLLLLKIFRNFEKMSLGLYPLTVNIIKCLLLFCSFVDNSSMYINASILQTLSR